MDSTVEMTEGSISELEGKPIAFTWYEQQRK